MAAPIAYGQYRIPTVDEQVHFGVGQVSAPWPMARARRRSVHAHTPGPSLTARSAHPRTQPAPSMLPLEKVRQATAAKMAEEDPLFLQVRPA
jgi:hypothetical protein